MTIQEITALRKAGRLPEATQAAEELFAANPDKYAASALFWCLNDRLRQTPSEEEKAVLADRLRSLQTQYGQGDHYMEYTVLQLDRMKDPLYDSIKEGLERGKTGGDVSSIYLELVRRFEGAALDPSHFKDFGWLAYYRLRHLPATDARERKKTLLQYLKLNLKRPSALHSLILGEAVKVEDNTPAQFQIRSFMEMWGWENLRDPEDWEQHKTEEGHTVPSLAEKLIKVYAKELRTDGAPAPQAFSALLDRALSRIHGNPHLPLYKAYELLSLGRKEEALEYYRILLLKTPARSFLWSQLSSLVEDMEMKTALLCKAVSVERDEQFIGKTRLRLAANLLDRNLPGLAAFELKKFKDFYTSRGWALKDDYRRLAGRVPGSIPLQDTAAMYAAMIPRAEEYLYGALPTVAAVKVSDRIIEDRNRRRVTLWSLKTPDGFVSLRNPWRWKLPDGTPNGTQISVKLLDGKVVWAKLL